MDRFTLVLTPGKQRHAGMPSPYRDEHCSRDPAGRIEERLGLGPRHAYGLLALAADEVWCRRGPVLSPHYQLTGLHGSEYRTYTLPRRVGAEQAARLTGECLPVSPHQHCGVAWSTG